MTHIETLSETPINAYILKEELKAIKKRDKELNFRASKTEDYLNSVLTLKNADQLFDKLKKLEIPRLRDTHIHKLVELVPTSPQDVKVVLQGYSINVSAENTKKIASLIKEMVN